MQTRPGLIVYRFDAPLFFVNSEHMRQRVLALVDAGDDVECVVLNAEAWTYLDATAIDMLEQLHGELADRGVTLAVARLKGPEREIFEDTTLTAKIGADQFFPTVRRLSMRSTAARAAHSAEAAAGAVPSSRHLVTPVADLGMERAVQNGRGDDEPPDEVHEEEERRHGAQAAVQRRRLLELRHEEADDQAVEHLESDRDDEGAG